MVPTPNWHSLAAWVALLFTIAQAAIVFGSMRGQVDQNTKAIDRLQQDGRTADQRLTEIQLGVETIRTKLEILLPTGRNEQAGAK